MGPYRFITSAHLKSECRNSFAFVWVIFISFVSQFAFLDFCCIGCCLLHLALASFCWRWSAFMVSKTTSTHTQTGNPGKVTNYLERIFPPGRRRRDHRRTEAN